MAHRNSWFTFLKMVIFQFAMLVYKLPEGTFTSYVGRYVRVI